MNNNNDKKEKRNINVTENNERVRNNRNENVEFDNEFDINRRNNRNENVEFENEERFDVCREDAEFADEDNRQDEERQRINMPK